MWQPPHPGCGTLTRQHPSSPYTIHMGSPVPLLTTVTHVQQASHHTSSSGPTHTDAAHTASLHRRQGTHAKPEPSHVLTWATCRYDHTAFSHTADSVNISWVPTWYLATPPLCEDIEHPQFTMVSSPNLHPLRAARTTRTRICVQ